MGLIIYPVIIPPTRAIASVISNPISYAIAYYEAVLPSALAGYKIDMFSP